MRQSAAADVRVAFGRWILLGIVAASVAGFCAAAAWALGGPTSPPTGTIAYVREWSQIRLIHPDGTGDRELWTQPPNEAELGHVQGLAFRPDGKELAFSSSHEMAFSFYEADLYAIGLDGKDLHRLTNTPSLEKLAEYPKCKVAVTVTNHSTDRLATMFVLYIVGASKPETLIVGRGRTATVTFEDVAVIPGALQPVMAAFGGERWPGPPLRLVAGQVNQAEMILLGGGFERWGAYRPVWSHDGKRVAFLFNQGAAIYVVPGSGEPGAGIGTPIGGEAARIVAAFDWGRPEIRGGSLLYARTIAADPGEEPENSVYQTDEQGHNPTQLLRYREPLKSIQQVRWLPDGSGFIVLRMEPQSFGDASNLCRYDLASGRETQLTRFMREAVRDFAISPDGQWIVYERGQQMYSPWDTARPSLWLMRMDGSDEHLLVENAGLPAWGR